LRWSSRSALSMGLRIGTYPDFLARFFPGAAPAGYNRFPGNCFRRGRRSGRGVGPVNDSCCGFQCCHNRLLWVSDRYCSTGCEKLKKREDRETK
jgi:hypothetical protein